MRERNLSASEAEASQGNETMMKTFSNVDNFSSVRDMEAVVIDPTQNGNEMQMSTQRVTDKTK